MNTAETINTDLGVFADWKPHVPEQFADSEFVFLANIDPEIQLATLRSVRAPKAIALDTMNYWIHHKREALLEVLSHVDIVSVNETEARQLCGTVSVPKAARDILALGPRAVVVKRGEYGSVLFTRSFSFWSPAFPFDEITDPTGAGDSFAGGFLGHLAESGSVDDRTLRRATLHGTVCASFAVERFSVDGIEAATPEDVAARYRLLQELVKV
jgi:sugar/nucleoside kinase (ribokinase family)